MSFYDDYGIGDAVQYFGADDYPMPTNLQAYLGSGDQEGDYPMPTNAQAYLGSGDQEGDYQMPTNPQTPGAFSGTGLGKFGEMLKGMGGKAMDFAGTPQGIMALLAAFAALKDKRGPSGGGATMGMQAPRQYTRTMTPGAYGPIARYAAEGGLMQAYAQGGTVQMEDGGFVLTKRAVDGAGGPMGIQQLVPGARMIRGPGTGTSDDIPAVINGQNGQTPARLSNGEAYVPRGAVQDQGGPKRMYALMNNLQRKA